IVVTATGVERQLQPAFVVEVDWLEELGRISDVNEDRNLETRRRLPDRVELGIVEMEPSPVRLLDHQSEPLADFPHANRTCLHGSLELAREFLSRSWSDIADIESREEDEPIAITARLHRSELLGQLVTAVRVGAHHHPQVEPVH